MTGSHTGQVRTNALSQALCSAFGFHQSSAAPPAYVQRLLSKVRETEWISWSAFVSLCGFKHGEDHVGSFPQNSVQGTDAKMESWNQDRPRRGLAGLSALHEAL